MTKKKEIFENKTVEEFLGKPPKWIIRWGITVLFVIISILFGASYFVHISDDIQLPLRPIGTEVIADSEWHIQEVLVESGTAVKKGTPLMRVSKGFSYQELAQLKEGFKNDRSDKNNFREFDKLLVRDSLILSPINGRLILEQPIQSGQTIPGGTLLAKITSSESQLVQASASSQYYDEIKHFKFLPITTTDGSIIQATVRNILVEDNLLKIDIEFDSPLEVSTAQIKVNRQTLFDKLFKRKRIN